MTIPAIPYVNKLSSSSVESDGEIRDGVTDKILIGLIQVDDFNGCQVLRIVDSRGYE